MASWLSIWADYKRNVHFALENILLPTLQASNVHLLYSGALDNSQEQGEGQFRVSQCSVPAAKWHSISLNAVSEGLGGAYWTLSAFKFMVLSQRILKHLETEYYYILK